MAERMRVDKRAGLAPAEKKEQYLAFVLGGESYAMDIRSVKEVIQYGGLTAVPLMPGFLRGVINLRGSVVPVIDFSVRFGRAPAETGRRTCIVILEVAAQGGAADLGVVVDNVSEVLEIGASDIEPAPTFGSRIRPDFLAGVGKVGGRFVILLDVDHMLSIEEMASLAEGPEAV